MIGNPARGGNLGRAVKPHRGDALLFWSMKTGGELDPGSSHAGCPVIKGEKWTATKWMHVAPVRDPSAEQRVFYEGREVGVPGRCEDADEGCHGWAENGECEKNPGFMLVSCKMSCGECAGRWREGGTISRSSRARGTEVRSEGWRSSIDISTGTQSSAGQALIVKSSSAADLRALDASRSARRAGRPPRAARRRLAVSRVLSRPPMRPRASPRAALASVLFLVALAARSVSCDDGAAASDAVVVAASDSAPTMHTIFSTECNAYFDWQSLGLMHSHRAVGQKGGFTRLMACDEQPPGVHIVPDTHVHPNYAVHPRTKDRYAPYNKPFSIMHWLEHAKPTADFIIVLDADMIFRTAMTAAMLGVERGRPISAHYGYLVGVFRQNLMKVKARVPNVENAQQVGGFTVMHREDLERVAPRWLYWTEEVRQDPDSWANTGDIFNGNGKNGPPWISEMYGYVFACAEARVDFKVSNDVMLYPGYQPPKEPWPAVLHYGITYHVDEYAFDKHWYMGGGPRNDFTTCPGRVFDKPPDASALLEDPAALNAGGKKSPWSSPGACTTRRSGGAGNTAGRNCRTRRTARSSARRIETRTSSRAKSSAEGNSRGRAREDERARGLRGGARARGGGTMTRGGGGIIAGDGGEGEKQTACGDDAGDDCCGWRATGVREKSGVHARAVRQVVRRVRRRDAVRRGVLPAREEERGRRVRFHPREEKRRRRVRRRRVRRRRVRKAAAEVVELGVVPDALGAAPRRGTSLLAATTTRDGPSRGRWSPPAPVLAFGVRGPS